MGSTRIDVCLNCKDKDKRIEELEGVLESAKSTMDAVIDCGECPICVETCTDWLQEVSALQSKEVCEWRKDSAIGITTHFHTSCIDYIYTEIPNDKYCPKCGKPIKEKL